MSIDTRARFDRPDPSRWPVRQDSPETLARASIVLFTFLTCAYFTTAAITTVFDSSSATLQANTQTLLVIALITPAIFLCLGVAERRIDVPYCIYWAWNFVFMGMAPAYQVAKQSFPWKGSISESTAAGALQLALLGHLAFLIAYWYLRRRKRATTSGAHTEVTSTALRKMFARISFAYCVVAVVFIGLMGSSLYNARAQFREQVLAISQLPFGGTLYFLVTAGAITVPSALIAARRAGSPIPTLTMVAPIVCAAVVTNPLLGSRFLTGSFLVSISIATLYGRALLRAIPVASIILLTVLFPTLDVLRGDASSSTEVRALDPATSVQTYDFDAYEMLAREKGLKAADATSLPSSTHLALAPAMRWVPLAARPFIGDSGGAVVAEATGMAYTNVSMPLPGEGDLIAGPFGTAALLAALGAWLGLSSTSNRRAADQGTATTATFATRVCAPATGALLFIVLRGSLYEVLAYLLLVLSLYVLIRRKDSTI